MRFWDLVTFNCYNWNHILNKNAHDQSNIYIFHKKKKITFPTYTTVQVCLCRTSTSNAVKAELLKSSKTQLTPVTIFSVYCHLASASGAWWQKLRDWGGASSLRPSGSLTQTQSHKHLQDSLLTVKHPYSHHPYCCFVYIPWTTRLHIPLAHPSCTSLLFILLFIKSQYTVFCTSYLFSTFYSIAHFTLISLFLPYICSCCVTFI